MKILAIDAAGETGWAFYDNAHPVDLIEYGTFTLPALRKGRKTIPDDHRGLQFMKFGHRMHALMHEWKPDVVAYETPAGQMSAMKNLYGYRSLALQIACCRDVPVVEIYPVQLKLWATGDARAKKPLMVSTLEKKHGLVVDNHNIADAVWLALWGSHISEK